MYTVHHVKERSLKCRNEDWRLKGFRCKSGHDFGAEVFALNNRGLWEKPIPLVPQSIVCMNFTLEETLKKFVSMQVLRLKQMSVDGSNFAHLYTLPQ